MTKIFLDVDKLEAVIKKIRSVATSAESARSGIDREFETEGDPISCDDFCTSASTAIEQLKNRATEIESCKDNIKRLNENGVAKMDSNGVISYDVPSPVTVQSSEQLQSLVQAAIDAKKTDGKASPEQILEVMNGSVAAHEDDSVYAAVFADIKGPEGMAELAYTLETLRQSESENVPLHDPNDPDTDYETRRTHVEQSWMGAQAALSTMFGTATNSPAWTPQHREKYAHQLAGLVTEENASPVSVLGFNYLMTGADRSAVNVVDVNGESRQSGGEFHKNFLLTVARDIQAHEQTSNEMPAWRQAQLNGGMSYPSTTNGSWDPMTGVLTAMGRQPQAALDFLAPPVDSRATEQTFKPDPSTFEWLRNRDWDATSFEGYTAALAAASEFRQPTTSTADERAAWISEQAVIDLAGREDGWFERIWTGDSRQNAAVILANSIQEVDKTANQAERSDDDSAFNASQPAGWKGRHDEEVKKLLQETLKDDVALQTVSDAAGKYAALRINSSLENLPEGTDSEEAFSTAGQSRKSDGTLLGYIYGAAEKGRREEGAQKDATAQMVLSAFGNGLSFIPGPQTPWVNTAVGIGKSYALDAMKDGVPSAAEQAGVEAGDMQNEALQQLNAGTYAALSTHGYLPQEVYVDREDNPYADNPKTPWIKRNSKGESYIDLDVLLSKPEYMSRFNGWTQDHQPLSGVSNDASQVEKGFEHGLKEGAR